MYLRICERFSFPIPWHGQNGRTLRHSLAMSGSAGLSPSRNRKREDSTLSEYARNLRKECAGLAAGAAVLTAEKKSAKEIVSLRAAVLKVSTARTFPVTRLLIFRDSLIPSVPMAMHCQACQRKRTNRGCRKGTLPPP